MIKIALQERYGMKNVLTSVFQQFKEPKPGLLALIGGSEDRHNGKGILRRLVDETGTRRVAVIPAASSLQEELDRDYQEAFRALGVEEVHPLIIGDREAADSDENIKKVNDSDLFFFTGGSQIRLLDMLEGSKIFDAVVRRHREGAAVAGTSAGAAAAGEWTIYYGDDCGTEKMACGWRRGFGFLPGAVVDTHFLERNRIYRLAQFLASGQCRRGIGIPEDTAVLVRDGLLEVAGSGVVTVMEAGNGCSSDFERVEKGRPVTVCGISVGFLPAGARFDLERWETVG